MSLLDYNEIKERKVIIHNGEPCEVMESHVARTQQRKPQNQVKLKSLLTGKTSNETFHVSDTAEEADITKKEVRFLYMNKGEFWFCDPTNPKDRFMLDEKILSDQKKFLKPNENTTALVFTNEDDEEKIIKISLPIKMEFLVKEAPPAIKGDTRTGGNKQVILENDAVINVPLFIEAGEKIRLNTETGEYVERV